MTPPTFSLNPHRRPAIGEDAPGTPSMRMLVLAIAGIWAAALTVAAIGLRAGTGAWPAGADEAVFLPITAGLLSLPVSLVRTGGAILGPVVFPLAFAFWPLMLGLQVRPCIAGAGRTCFPWPRWCWVPRGTGSSYRTI